ncbi:LPXTG cell wall anchor domain-containing protein [Agrococcus jejuensis]|uniref:LPXTG cell wall anchor domain-containing protein n=1 Tax=Agrococcus jejuensis TaxID=399736 RepID=UPI0011AB1E45|nr:LPXTG cell wall anchor domain-containing protein [Agrococcus jejuensis]
MELCVLPQTGAGEHWLLLVAIAALVIAAGVALALSGRARRSVLTGLGALAIVGALVVAGIGGAPSAQADTGSSQCATAPARQTPAPAAAAIVVTPGIPTTTVQCAAEPSLQVPTTTGVVYSQTRTGSSVTVTAAAAPGYAILAGAVTSWTYDLTPSVRAPWPVALPAATQGTLEVDIFGGPVDTLPIVPDDADDAALVPSLQAAQDAGTLTYSLDGSGYTESQEFGVYDGETDEQLATGIVTVSYPTELTFDFEAGEYRLRFFGVDEDIEAQYQAQLAALTAPFPGSYANPLGGFPPSIDITGLNVIASYEPGPGCATETAIVPLETDVEFLFPPVGLDAGFSARGGLVSSGADAAEESLQAPIASEVPAAAPVTEVPAEAPTEVVESPEPEAETPVEG